MPQELSPPTSQASNFDYFTHEIGRNGTSKGPLVELNLNHSNGENVLRVSLKVKGEITGALSFQIPEGTNRRELERRMLKLQKAYGSAVRILVSRLQRDVFPQAHLQNGSSFGQINNLGQSRAWRALNGIIDAIPDDNGHSTAVNEPSTSQPSTSDHIFDAPEKPIDPSGGSDIHSYSDDILTALQEQVASEETIVTRNDSPTIVSRRGEIGVSPKPEEPSAEVTNGVQQGPDSSEEEPAMEKQEHTAPQYDGGVRSYELQHPFDGEKRPLQMLVRFEPLGKRALSFYNSLNRACGTPENLVVDPSKITRMIIGDNWSQPGEKTQTYAELEIPLEEAQEWNALLMKIEESPLKPYFYAWLTVDMFKLYSEVKLDNKKPAPYRLKFASLLKHESLRKSCTPMQALTKWKEEQLTIWKRMATLRQTISEYQIPTKQPKEIIDSLCSHGVRIAGALPRDSKFAQVTTAWFNTTEERHSPETKRGNGEINGRHVELELSFSIPAFRDIYDYITGKYVTLSDRAAGIANPDSPPLGIRAQWKFLETPIPLPDKADTVEFMVSLDSAEIFCRKIWEEGESQELIDLDSQMQRKVAAELCARILGGSGQLTSDDIQKLIEEGVLNCSRPRST